MCVYDYDRPKVYTQHHRTARKPHPCSECGRHIQPGERYLRTFGVWDGKADTFLTCPGCELALDWLMTACSGYMHGDIYDELRDHFDGDEFAIWQLDKMPDHERKYVVPEFKLTTWRPPMSKLWVGRVLVGMRRKWQWPDGRPITVPPFVRKAEAS